MCVVLDETVSTTAACSTLLVHLGTLATFEDNLCLLDNTLGTLLAVGFGLCVLFTTSVELFSVELLALALFDVGCETNNTISGELLQVFGCDGSG